MPLNGDVDRQLFAWSFRHNLVRIVRYHNFMRAKLHEHYQLQAVDDAERNELNRYDSLNANNCFLMAYAHLEEMLYSVWRVIAPDTDLEKSSSVERFKPALRVAGVNVGNSSAWSFVQDASRVRDCLLHANGRVSHVTRGKQQLQACIRKYPDLHLVGDRLSLTPDYLKRFIIEVGNLQREIVQA